MAEDINVEEGIEVFQNRVRKAIDFISFHEYEAAISYKPVPGGPDPYEARRERQEVIDKATNEAEKILEKPEILKHICPALKRISGDVFDIAKILVGVLVPLGIAGTIVVPWNPLMIGVLAFIIWRAGIASICDKYEKGDS